MAGGSHGWNLSELAACPRVPLEVAATAAPWGCAPKVATAKSSSAATAARVLIPPTLPASGLFSLVAVRGVGVQGGSLQ